MSIAGIAQSESLGRHVEIQSVARSGDDAFGPGVDLTFEFFHRVWISDSGHVAFDAIVRGAGVNVSNRGGIWAGLPGQIVNAVRHGQTVSEVNQPILTSEFAHVNNKGEIAIEGEFSGTPRGEVIWTGIPTQVQVAAIAGMQAPDVESGVVFSGFSPTTSIGAFEEVQFNDLSQLTFKSYLSGPGIPTGQHGLWTGPPNDLRLIARTDSQAHGLPDNISYSYIFDVDNPGGVLAFGAFLKGASITEDNDVGLWLGPSEDVRLIAREGDPAPGIDSATFSVLGINNFEVDHSGRLIFPARVEGNQINVTNDYGYWRSSGNAMELLYRSGDPAPNIAEARLASFRVEPIVSDEYLLLANLVGENVTSANDGAMFVGTPGNMRLIYREGDPAPGAPEGVVMGRVFTSSSGIPTSETSQLAFRTELTGPGVDGTNDAAYYMVDSNGKLFLLAREGDMFDVGGGELKQIQEVHNTLGGPTDETMNAHGQLIFRVTFMDNTQGVYIAQIVPEPNSVALILSGTLAVIAFTLRKRMVTPRRRVTSYDK